MLKLLTIAVLTCTFTLQAIAAKKTYVYNKKTFMESFNNPNTTNKDTKFIKKYYKKADTLLDRIEYIDFLKDYLEKFFDNLPEDETVKEEAEKLHRETIENYLKLKEEVEDYDLDQAIHDISLGNLMVYVDVGHHESEDDDDVTAEDIKIDESPGQVIEEDELEDL